MCFERPVKVIIGTPWEPNPSLWEKKPEGNTHEEKKPKPFEVKERNWSDITDIGTVFEHCEIGTYNKLIELFDNLHKSYKEKYKTISGLIPTFTTEPLKINNINYVKITATITDAR